MIHLYTLPRIWTKAINLCPFCIKVEFWLRLHQIEYKHHGDFLNTINSPTGLVPWIKDSSNKITDSTVIIDYLAEKFNINNTVSSYGELIISMIENELFWIIKYLRHFRDESFKIIRRDVTSKFPAGVKSLIQKKIRKTVLNQCQAQGIGKYDIGVVAQRGLKCLILLIDMLGDNEYFSGGETPNRTDVVVFSALVNLLNAPFYDDILYKAMHSERLLKLKMYVNRICKKYFNDLVTTDTTIRSTS